MEEWKGREKDGENEDDNVEGQKEVLEGKIVKGRKEERRGEKHQEKRWRKGRK